RPYFFVEILQHVGRARGAQRAQERLELIALEELGDLGEIGGVDLLRLDGEIARRLLEERDDIGREQGRDRTVLWISRRWRHGAVLTWMRGVNIPTASAA